MKTGRWTAGTGRVGAALLAAAVLAAPVRGQEETSGEAAPVEEVEFPWAAPVPFGPGERLEYQVKMGVFSVGDGALSVPAVDTVRGHPTYRLVMDLEGGIPLARVDDRFQSWLDVETLLSRRFVQSIREAGYESDRHYEIYPEEGRWERADEEGNEGEMPTAFPLDDVSFLYFVRTLDLTPGKEYRINRYFKEDGNPVVVKVVGRETLEVPAGTFETVVVRPVIQTDGLFSEGGEAELYFTDDEDHYLVYMRVKIPVVRSLTLHLRDIQPGRALASGDSRARSDDRDGGDPGTSSDDGVEPGGPESDPGGG